MKWFAVLLLTVSCGPEYDIRRSNGTPGELPACEDDVCIILQEFFDDAEKYSVDLVWRISRVELMDFPSTESAAGYCQTLDRGYISHEGILIPKIKHWQGGYIALRKDLWKKYSIHQKRNLIYHEAGHCYMNLNHREDGVQIMNSKMMSEPGKDWDKKVKTLFGVTNE